MDARDGIREREPGIEPSADFADRVMAAVRAEPLRPLPIAFPWRSIAIAASLSVAASAALVSSPAVVDRVESGLHAFARASSAIDTSFAVMLGVPLAFTLVAVQFAMWISRRTA